jgi:hypothetical protein
LSLDIFLDFYLSIFYIQAKEWQMDESPINYEIFLLDNNHFIMLVKVIAMMIISIVIIRE